MKTKIFYTVVLSALFAGISTVSGQKSSADDKIKKVLYFNPEVEPDIEEIKEPTNYAFFSAVSDNLSNLRRNKMIRSEVQVPFDSLDVGTITEYSENNDADFVIVPKVKYFKVGIGKYVFSNQVVVSMKLYNAQGQLITSTDYDTYRKNMRMLGSTANSIKIGTNGAMKEILKKLRTLKPSADGSF